MRWPVWTSWTRATREAPHDLIIYPPPRRQRAVDWLWAALEDLRSLIGRG